MALLFESIPMVLALFAVVFAARRGLLTRDRHVKRIACMGMMCAMLMLVAQTSWAWSVFAGNRMGEDYANVLWTLFNTLAMVTIIYASIKGTK